VYGALTFILEHPKEIDVYLHEQHRRYEEFKTEHRIPPDMLERFERGRRELLTRRS
jgi:hypothetical protein